MAVTSGYWVAFAARLLGGLAHAGFFSVVFAAAISFAPPGKQGRAVAFVGAGNAAALVLGVPLGTAVGTAIGWRWAFAGCSITMLVFAVLIALVLPTTQPPSAHIAQLSVLTAARSRPLLIVAAVIVVLTLVHYTPFTYLSPLLQDAGVNAASVSPVLLGYGAAGIFGLPCAQSLPIATLGAHSKPLPHSPRPVYWPSVWPPTTSPPSRPSSPGVSPSAPCPPLSRPLPCAPRHGPPMQPPPSSTPASTSELPAVLLSAPANYFSPPRPL